MQIRRFTAVVVGAVMAAGAGEAGAAAQSEEPVTQESQDAATREDIEELSRQIEILAEEVERLRSGEPEQELSSDDARELGLGGSAASVYERTDQGVSIAGYGEMVMSAYGARDESGTPVNRGSTLDFLRAIFYFGYRFDDRFLFNSEIEVEHADEIFVEFAYIDYVAHEAATLRGGMVLLPMGLTNEFHEPTAFLSANRPHTETRLIPTTWRENGFGVVGSKGPVSYRGYVVNGLDGSGFTADGLRGGRQKGSKARFSDPAVVGRVDVTPVPGVFVGGSFYVGDASQDQFFDGTDRISVQTRIGEVHAQAQIRGFDVRGLFARSSLDDVHLLNTALGLEGENGIGSVQQGGYVQVGYNVLSQLPSTAELTPFYRFETLDTQSRVAPGFARDPATDREFHTVGVSFKPIPNVAIKADYEFVRTGAGTGVDQFGLALGYSF